MSLLIASLYLLCLAFLFGSALYVYSRDPFSRLNRAYALLAFSLMGWVGSLFVFNAQTGSAALLWLGRANFAAAVLVAPAAYSFVCALARKPLRYKRLIAYEAVLLAAVSLLTGWVDRAETVLSTGWHVTDYGALFPLYLVHIVAFLAGALLLAFRPDRHLTARSRLQLRLVGVGILVTTVVGILTNAVLPYFFGDFRLIDAGTLSTIFFLAVVAYAAVYHHLFNVRIILRATLVYAVMIVVALEFYQIAVEFLARLLPLGDPTQQHVAAATIAFVINAFTHEPLRLWLEQLADRLLDNKKRHRTASR